MERQSFTTSHHHNNALWQSEQWLATKKNSQFLLLSMTLYSIEYPLGQPGPAA